MNIDDNVNALFVEPNAYIAHYDSRKEETKPIKKVVFSEPYECMPNYYIDNNLNKGNCDCLPKPKPKCQPNNPFDFSKLLPLISLFTKGGGGDMGSLISLLANTNNANNPLFSLLGNKDILNTVTKLFTGNKTNIRQKMKSTDCVIDDYERV